MKQITLIAPSASLQSICRESCVAKILVNAKMLQHRSFSGCCWGWLSMVFSSFQLRQAKVSAPSSLHPLCSGMPWPSSRRASSARCSEPWIKMYVYPVLLPSLLASSGSSPVGFWSYVILEQFVVTGYLHAKPRLFGEPLSWGIMTLL